MGFWGVINSDFVRLFNKCSKSYVFLNQTNTVRLWMIPTLPSRHIKVNGQGHECTKTCRLIEIHPCVKWYAYLIEQRRSFPDRESW